MTPHFLLRSLVTLSTLAVMFAAAPAQARFGKRAEPEQSQTKKRGKQAKKSEVRAERGHAATAVRPRSSRVYVSGDDCCYDEVYVRPHAHGYVVVQPSPVYVSRGYRPEYQEEERYAPEQRVEAFATAQPMLNGGMLGVNLRVDWARLGVDARYDGLALWADDGSWSVDTIHMLDGTMTFSFFASDRARLRAHLGLYSAFAPDAVFVGPGGGLSASIDLFGPLTADAGGHLVLIPFTKVDSYAALGLRLGFLEARGGLRFTVLSDQGRVDGVQHTDVLAGPYLSLGVVL